MTRFDEPYYEQFYGPSGVHDRERIGHVATAGGTSSTTSPAGDRPRASIW